MSWVILGKIEFEKRIQKARLRSPLQDFKLVTQSIEVRKDPLTGRRCRINIERAKRPKQAPQTTEFGNIIERSKAKCFFCLENIEKSTPMFPEGFPDRIKVGDACVFPNLFPFGGFHAVGVFFEGPLPRAKPVFSKIARGLFRGMPEISRTGPRRTGRG